MDNLKLNKLYDEGRKLYHQLKHDTAPQKIEKLTIELIRIKSINSTIGESQIGAFIRGFISSIPYFASNTEQLWTQHLPNDPFERYNIFALVENRKGRKDTVIYHCHLDTVGVEDFGPIKKSAFCPEELKEFFAQYDSDLGVKQDACSDEWLFGRGSVDMKSGIAVHLINIINLTENMDQLEGNVLLMINPVEENQHTGIIEATRELSRLKEEKKWNYVIAINNDFCTELYQGDPTRYVYMGAAGKLLPCFYIQGKEVHVGETLTGIDPTLLSSELNRRINNNIELTEHLPGELVLPPSCLYQRDLKDFYNVQTPLTSFIYFNYFIYTSSPKDVMDTLLALAKDVCKDIKSYMFDQYTQYVNRTGLPRLQQTWEVEVSSYSQYKAELIQKGIPVADIEMKTINMYKDELEPRLLAFKIIEELQKNDHEKIPRIIIFFAPPFCPHNYLDTETKGNKRKHRIIEHVLDEVGKDTGEQFAIKKFFPYLSDSSYLSIDDTEEEIDSLIMNFPQWDQIYPVPIKEIRKLDIPAINIGVYGKDAHKWTERVYKPYTFEVLPSLIRKVTERLLCDQVEEDSNE